MLSLDEIRNLIRELANRIDAPSDLQVTFGNSRNDSTPDIDVGAEAYFYTARDRDFVEANRRTSDIDELLYWVFEHITSIMATAYVRMYRSYEYDSRRSRFDHQMSLLGKLNVKWKERFEKEIEHVLKKLID